MSMRNKKTRKDESDSEDYDQIFVIKSQKPLSSKAKIHKSDTKMSKSMKPKSKPIENEYDNDPKEKNTKKTGRNNKKRKTFTDDTNNQEDHENDDQQLKKKSTTNQNHRKSTKSKKSTDSDSDFDYEYDNNDYLEFYVNKKKPKRTAKKDENEDEETNKKGRKKQTRSNSKTSNKKTIDIDNEEEENITIKKGKKKQTKPETDIKNSDDSDIIIEKLQNSDEKIEEEEETDIQKEGKKQDKPKTKTENKSVYVIKITSSSSTDTEYDVTTISGRSNISQQTLDIIRYGEKMGKYSVRLPNGKIEQVDISKQICISFKYTKEYMSNYMAKINNEFFENIGGFAEYFRTVSFYVSDKTINLALTQEELDRNDQLSKNLREHYLYNISLPNDSPNKLKMCEFYIVDGPSTAAVQILSKKEKLRTCILNFTIPTIDPINFTIGQESQENSLMRQTSLYVTLKDKDIYENNNSIKDVTYDDSMIYSSRVPVFRDPKTERLLGQNEVFETSVITAFLPDIHAPKYMDVGWGYINPIENNSILKSRLRRMICLAIEHKNQGLVISLDGSELFKDKKGIWKNILFDLFCVESLGLFFKFVAFAKLGRDSEEFDNIIKTFTTL